MTHLTPHSQPAGSAPDDETMRAARAFLQRLEGRYPVAEGILFGSRARRTHHAGSDADLAVVLNGAHGDRTAAALDMAGIAFEVMLDTGVLVEALPLWADELNSPELFGNPALIRNIQREGVRLPGPAMTPAIYMEKAERALAGARLLLEAQDTEGACNRAYYAMFDAAHAALLAACIPASEGSIRTHAGLIATFGKHLVQAGLMDAEFGRSFNKVQRLRQLADYTGDTIALADAAWAVEQAGAFVQAMRDKFMAHSPSSLDK